MNAIKIDRKQARMIAHRGLSGIELENSCAAFVAAGNREYWGIETDVHKTADGKFIIFHDDVTGRVAVKDLPVELTTLEMLRQLPLKEVRNHDALRTDLRMPIPEEYFAICKRYDKVAVFELKNPMEKPLIEDLVKLADSCMGLQKVVFISFSFQNLVYVREVAPAAICQFLTSGEITDALIEKLIDHRMDLDAYHLRITPEVVQKLHAANLEVNCWTVDDPERAAQLVDMGVDYITTNILV